MFNVANWLKTNFHCMVFLPLRDTTFDQYRKTPPLDTAIKDLTFRIDPPLLDKVLQARYEYVLREISKNSKDFFYTLNNGFRVQCKREDIGSYLKAILSSIFQNDHTKRVFLGLTGRDIRKGLEIFLDFCKSGYITEEEILRIRNSHGLHPIPPNAAMQILIKGTRRFYNDSFSRIRNVFNMYKDDQFPDPYVRISILEWLAKHYGENGPKNIKSYHSINAIIKDLKVLGHDENRIKKEIEEMILSDLLISESQQKKYPDEDELITSSGFVHLDLVQNIYYLAFMSEDTFFESEKIAQNIADNLLRKDSYLYLSHQTILENARILVDYLAEYQQKANFKFENYIQENEVINYCNMKIIKDWIHRKIEGDSSYIDYEALMTKYPNGFIGDARIINKMTHMYLVSIGINSIGFLPKNGNTQKYDIGEMIKIKILSFNHEHKKFEVEPVNEDD